MAVAATIIFTFVAIDKRHTRFEGAMFIMLYCFYVGWLIGWL
jgi:Ca2+/Na+ antiporter